MSEDLFSSEVQPLFENHRAAFLTRAREAAIKLGKKGKGITVDDVRAVVAIPTDIDPRVMGAVFRTPDWVKVGYENSGRRTCHGRPIAVFRLQTRGQGELPLEAA